MELYDGCTGKPWTDKKYREREAPVSEGAQEEKWVFGICSEGQSPCHMKKRQKRLINAIGRPYRTLYLNMYGPIPTGFPEGFADKQSRPRRAAERKQLCKGRNSS